GLVVVGVHTPEFSFEKDLANVRREVKEMQIGYPIAVDSDFGVWRAFRNNAWPAFYFIDAQGRIRHSHFGEGDYERSERVLQELLAEAGSADARGAIAPAQGRGAEVAADWDNLQSPETYLGADRADRFASPGANTVGRQRMHAIQPRLPLN